MRFGASTGARVKARKKYSGRSISMQHDSINLNLKGETALYVVDYESVKVMA